MMRIRAISLQSGSNGNSIYVETPSTKLLFDAGISGKQAAQRLSAHGIQIRDVDALFISHDHSDHSKGAGVFHRKFGLQVHATEKTLSVAQRKCRLGAISRVRFFESGETVIINDVRVTTIPTPHDGVDGVAFVVESGGARLGILTDLGHPFTGLQETLCGLDAVFLESNYDPQMLKEGPYPYYLKRRIQSSGGHISNEECGVLLAPAFESRLQWACLAHLSETNNDPAIALSTAKQLAGEERPIYVASRYNVSPIFTL